MSRLKWTDSQLKYFNKPIKTAELTNDWSWWAIFGVVVIMEVMLILKILGKI